LAGILIIGVDGVIGAALAQALTAAGHAVCGTSRREHSEGPGKRIRLDLAEPDAADTALPAADVVIFCAAMARFADCREQPELTRRVNVTAPAAIARRFTEAGSQIVMLSTSAVFNGRLPHVPADQPRSPVSAYGTQKAEIEAGILALGGKASVLRLTKVIAPNMPLLRGWIDALARQERIRAFTDLTVSPIRIADVVSAASAVIADGNGGIYQVSGSDDVSYETIARWLVRALGVSTELVQGARAVEVGIPAGEVSEFNSLDTSRLQAITGWQPPSARAVLEDVFGRFAAAARALA
jgi:dTDP-4-dehydrorhamnose reductase